MNYLIDTNQVILNLVSLIATSFRMPILRAFPRAHSEY